MLRFLKIFIAVVGLGMISSCGTCEQKDAVSGDDEFMIRGPKNYLKAYPAVYDNGDVNVVIEIPAGSDQKWEVDKSDGSLKWELAGNEYRRIQYLPYPVNYGMIPRSLLPESLGGDGDPLDVIVLGPALERGSVRRCKVIGILFLLDKGEEDHKLIAVGSDSRFCNFESLNEIEMHYPGVSTIIRTWFVNYKGPGIISSPGFGEKKDALKILDEAIKAYDAMVDK